MTKPCKKETVDQVIHKLENLDLHRIVAGDGGDQQWLPVDPDDPTIIPVGPTDPNDLLGNP